MRSDLTDMTLVVDRSGSMQSIRTDAQGGVNSFVRKQAEEPGEAYVTLVQFDHEYEFVNRGVRAAEFPDYVLLPRGSTALLDAIGRAITETGERLAKIPEAARPGLVIFVVMTDGEENASREFSRDRIRQMIEHQQKAYNWQFTFLGANQEAFAEAGALGVSPTRTALFSPDKVGAALNAASNQVSRLRKQSRNFSPLDNSWTEAERKSME